MYIICQGESNIQVKAIADRILRNTRTELSIRALHVEGMRQSTWVLLDYFDIVVHVFYPETRVYYDLEGLWNDGKMRRYDLEDV